MSRFILTTLLGIGLARPAGAIQVFTYTISYKDGHQVGRVSATPSSRVLERYRDFIGEIKDEASFELAPGHVIRRYGARGYHSLITRGEVFRDAYAEHIDRMRMRGKSDLAILLSILDVEKYMQEKNNRSRAEYAGPLTIMLIRNYFGEASYKQRVDRGEIVVDPRASLPHISFEQEDPPGMFVLHNIRSVKSGYGMRRDPITRRRRMHRGVDFSTDGHNRAARAGVVEEVVLGHSLNGNFIVIDHGAIGGEHYKSIYLHNDKVLVKKGERVSRGQIIGETGETGRARGRHLHFVLKINDRLVDPQKYLKILPAN